MNGCAPGLALKERLYVTRKWSIISCSANLASVCIWGSFFIFYFRFLYHGSVFQLKKKKHSTGASCLRDDYSQLSPTRLVAIMAYPMRARGIIVNCYYLRTMPRMHILRASPSTMKDPPQLQADFKFIRSALSPLNHLPL